MIAAIVAASFVCGFLLSMLVHPPNLNQYRGLIQRCKDKDAMIDDLLTSLGNYGKHKYDCSVYTDEERSDVCSCGFLSACEKGIRSLRRKGIGNFQEWMQ